MSNGNPPGAAFPAECECSRCRRLIFAHPDMRLVIAYRHIQPQTVRWCECGVNAVAAQDDKLVRYASLPEHNDGTGPRTFDNFDHRKGCEDGVRAARDYAEGRLAAWLCLLTGPNGTGKSHLAEAIGRTLLARGCKPKYVFTPDLMDELRATQQPESRWHFLDVLEKYKGAEVLILDDLGAEKPSEWVAEKVMTLVDDRCRNSKRLVVTTNLVYDDVVAQYGGSGPRLASRLWGQFAGAHVVTMRASDYRIVGAR